MNRILSIQSHVTFGYVGNKSATFPLQLLGYDVDAINTVNFSNHTGYGKFTGVRFDKNQLLDIFNGLEYNGLTHYDNILVGYLGSSSLVEATATIVSKVKQLNPKTIFVLDPVMGDDGRLYVPSDVLPLYRSLLLPLADVVTPNQTEAEHITGIKFDSPNSISKTFEYFHNLDISYVIITSGQPTMHNERSFLTLYGSQQISGCSNRFKINIPLLNGDFGGTGDLFSALLLGWLNRLEDEEGKCKLAKACEKVVASIQAVINRTIANPFKCVGDKVDPATKVELRLVGDNQIFLDPKVELLSENFEI